MTIAEVLGGFDGLSFGAGDRNDKVVLGEVEMAEIKLTKRAEEFAKKGRENLEPTGLDGGVIKPVDALFAILRSVDRGVWVETMEL